MEREKGEMQGDGERKVGDAGRWREKRGRCGVMEREKWEMRGDGERKGGDAE